MYDVRIQTVMETYLGNIVNNIYGIQPGDGNLRPQFPSSYEMSTEEISHLIPDNYIPDTGTVAAPGTERMQTRVYPYKEEIKPVNKPKTTDNIKPEVGNVNFLPEEAPVKNMEERAEGKIDKIIPVNAVVHNIQESKQSSAFEKDNHQNPPSGQEIQPHNHDKSQIQLPGQSVITAGDMDNSSGQALAEVNPIQQNQDTNPQTSEPGLAIQPPKSNPPEFHNLQHDGPGQINPRVVEPVYGIKMPDPGPRLVIGKLTVEVIMEKERKQEPPVIEKHYFSQPSASGQKPDASGSNSKVRFGLGQI
jgi:hypothetical protein